MGARDNPAAISRYNEKWGPLETLMKGGGEGEGLLLCGYFSFYLGLGIFCLREVYLQ